MACTTHSGGLTLSTFYQGNGTSAYFRYLSAISVSLDYITLMIGSGINAASGRINADYIFLKKDASINLGQNVRIYGKVYLVEPEDFDNIYWTWTNSSMRSYINEHKLHGVDYYNEPYDAHSSELLGLSTTQISE